MRLTPIRFVNDVTVSRAFYRLLGLGERTEATSPGWSELPTGGGALCLHTANPPVTMASGLFLQFTTEEPLEELTARLIAHGYKPTSILDETFGRFFTVEDPDGMLVQVNEEDPDLQGLSY